MRNRTRVMAAAAAVTAALAGSTAAALASTPGATPGITPATKTTTTAASVSGTSPGTRCTAGTDVATRLGVTPGRLGQALRSVKPVLVHETGGTVTESRFDAAVARNLGVSPAKVQLAFAAGNPDCAKPSGPSGGSKPAPSPAAERQARAAMTAAVASELHVSTARVSAALRPLFAEGRVDSSSAVFATAARSLGVSTQQLNSALTHAKQSMAGSRTPAGSQAPAGSK